MPPKGKSKQPAAVATTPPAAKGKGGRPKRSLPEVDHEEDEDESGPSSPPPKKTARGAAAKKKGGK